MQYSFHSFRNLSPTSGNLQKASSSGILGYRHAVSVADADKNAGGGNHLRDPFADHNRNRKEPHSRGQ